MSTIRKIYLVNETSPVCTVQYKLAWALNKEKLKALYYRISERVDDRAEILSKDSVETIVEKFRWLSGDEYWGTVDKKEFLRLIKEENYTERYV